MEQSETNTESVTVTVTPNGPYLVKGKVPIKEARLTPDETGVITKYQIGEDKNAGKEQVMLCRCGKSRNKPFCDGQHIHGFHGVCRAPHLPILSGAETFSGPNLTLHDNEKYCAFARFCDGFGRIWNLVRQGQPITDQLTVREAHLCPAGRLIITNNQTGAVIESEAEPLILVIEDPQLKVSGPLGLRGNITVTDDNGKPYEKRRLQALCRCGKSKNTPFCDGSHAADSPALHESEESFNRQ